MDLPPDEATLGDMILEAWCHDDNGALRDVLMVASKRLDPHRLRIFRPDSVLVSPSSDSRDTCRCLA